MSREIEKSSLPSVTITMPAMAFLTVCAIFSLRNLPNMAEYGWSVLFILTASCLCFFIPSALVSAELASAYPEKGGVFVWVREAYGPKWGFLAIFMEWVQNLPWYPACLTFIAASLAYAIDPSLADNRWFIFVVIQIGMWGATLLNSRGMKDALFLSNFGVIVGTVIPGIIIILLAAIYLLNGNPIVIPFHQGRALLPDFSDLGQWMLLAGMMVSLAGMEMSAVHIKKMASPSQNYPKAIFLAAFIVIVLSTLGSLSIAFVVPSENLSLASGVCQAFEEMLKRIGFQWLAPVLALLLAFGAFAMVATWINGPSNGLLEVAQEGYLPKRWQRRNAKGMPTPIFFTQAIFASLISLSVFFVPTISDAFWIFSALCSQLYMIMYLLMFAAAIKLRRTHPEVPRPYKVPGGNVGICVISGTAFLTSLIAFCCGFIPPKNVVDSGILMTLGYECFLVIGVVFFTSVPLLSFRRYQIEKKQSKESWK